MDQGFSLIIANFRTEKLEEVEKKLEHLGVERINVSKVRGFGEYHNYYAHNWLESEVRVEIFTKNHEVEAIVKAIMETARTGKLGAPRRRRRRRAADRASVPDPQLRRGDPANVLAAPRGAGAQRGVTERRLVASRFTRRGVRWNGVLHEAAG